MSFLKPHYLWRPSQGLRRLLQAAQAPPGGSMLIELPWGLRIRIDARDEIGRAIWQQGLYDLVVSEVLWRLVSPGDLAVDVGANIGAMTGLMALRAGPGGHVLAFEPHPQVFHDLAENMALLAGDPRLAPCDLHREAVSNVPGTAFLQDGEQFATNRGTARLAEESAGAIPVVTATLDQILAGRVANLVKIDVEGMEDRVLLGAEDSLRRGAIRNLVYEAYGEQARSLAQRLQAFGYSVRALGMSFFGLILSEPEAGPVLPAYEPPSYLATREPGATLPLLTRLGWQALHARS